MGAMEESHYTTTWRVNVCNNSASMFLSKLVGVDVNGFVVTSEGVVMIDTPQKPTDAIAWRETIAPYGPEALYMVREKMS
jgi:hypothetical protein